MISQVNGGAPKWEGMWAPLRWTVSSSESKQTKSGTKQGDVWEEEKKMEEKTDEWG